MKRLLTALLICTLSSVLPGCAMMMRIQAANASKTPANARYYRGTYHVHSQFSHDSVASLPTIQKTARRAGLDFVVITDHNTLRAMGAYEEMILLKEPQSKVPLLLFGNEISARDGHIVALGVYTKPPDNISSQNLLQWIHENKGYSILSHPFSEKNPWKNWKVTGYDAFEVYSFSHRFYEANKFKLALTMPFLSPKSFLRSFQKVPKEALTFWDRQLLTRPLPAFSAADAHLHWKKLGITFENLLMAFQSSTMYVQAAKLERDNIIRSLEEGRSYIAFEARGNAQAFSFSASDAKRTYYSGDTVPVADGLKINVEAPRATSIRLIHNGKVVESVDDDKLYYRADYKGYYRVEAYREGEIWIIANPIYVKDQKVSSSAVKPAR